MKRLATPDDRPAAIGWHDSHCASAALVAPCGKILYAAAEERFRKQKLYKGHPSQTLQDMALRYACEDASWAYADLSMGAKVARNLGLISSSMLAGRNTEKSLLSLVRTAGKRFTAGHVDGVAGTGPETGQSTGQQPRFDTLWDHHSAHAASAYYCSGFASAWILTVDGVGDCLSGTLFEGRDGRLTRKKKFYYNELTVGADYEAFTAMMGFNPDRHCGKITGLAAYGRPNDDCLRALEAFFADSWRSGRRNWFDRMHGPEAESALAELRAHRQNTFGAFSREDLSHAMQYLAERRVTEIIEEHVPNVAGSDIALAGGVFANVRINQKVKSLGFRRIFVQPAMDDGGLALGVAQLHLARSVGLLPQRLPHTYLGPCFDDDHTEEALQRSGAPYERVEHSAYAVARLLAEGRVVARCAGPMEFGPRALGNRSILCDPRDPTINDWLNERLQRTEFMPFAPATLRDHAERCYEQLEGCEHTAEFMTITFDCTADMKRACPAVVHVDGTARPQLVRPDTNPGFYEIIDEFHKLTGLSSVVNTSFNMHESPIVNTPEDAIQSFQQGQLDHLLLGPFLVSRSQDAAGVSAAAAEGVLSPAFKDQ